MRKMLTLIIFCLLSLELNASDKDKLNKDIENLTYNQRNVLFKTYFDSTEVTKLKNERLLLTAIAWKESEFGENLVSPTQDYGTFQINIKSFNSRFGKDIEAAGLSKHTKSILKKNHNVGLKCAYAELSHWKKVYKNDLNKVIASYNDGTNITYIGERYAQDIKNRMSILNSYIEKRTKI